jgi:hypothetical protein
MLVEAPILDRQKCVGDVRREVDRFHGCVDHRAAPRNRFAFG